MQISSSKCLAAALVVVLGLAGCAIADDHKGVRGKGPAVEMSSSAIFFYNSEFEPHYGQPISQCSLLLRRAKEASGGSRVNIVPTQYWIDTFGQRQFKPWESQCNPDGWAEANKVDYFCHKWEWDSECRPFDEATIKQWTDNFADCLQEAHDLFDTVLISPHLDEGARTGKWRNMLVFDPLKKDRYGYSYYDIMTVPILNAAKRVYTRPGKGLWFGLQGEMGGTVFAHPDSYTKIAHKVKSEWKSPATLKTGVLLNHGYIAGVINRAPDVHGAIPESKWWRYDGAFGAVLPFSQWPRYAQLKAAVPGVKRLLDTVDFYGISNYARTPAQISAVDLESGTRKQEAEYAAMGIDLAKQIAKPGKFFIWNEFAIGGGISECGNETATNGVDAGLFPWLGATSTYTKATDPWQNPTVGAYMRDYYRKGLQLLGLGGINYKVSGAFIWNVVSWDVQGIHPASSSGEGSFADAQSMAMIKEHNVKVNAARVAKPVAKPVPKSL